MVSILNPPSLTGRGSGDCIGQLRTVHGMDDGEELDRAGGLVPLELAYQMPLERYG